MRYEMMLPYQIRDAIARNLPVVLPLGVLEYHGEHMAVGMDTLAVTAALDLIDKEADIVILPSFYYGSASFAVEPPEGNGSVHVDSSALHPFARELFTGLLRVGFRNIHAFIHHQSENFDVGMPTDLAFKFGAKQAVFTFIERTRGEGWWGDNQMADYYARQAEGDDPFNWIKIHPLMTQDIISQFPFDHAGEGETSLMMAMCPGAVDMDKFDDERWYVKSAANASADLGKRGRELILAHLRGVLGLPKR
jgi:creatinine amidohydrolase/Fe(II)-dependent formamide hydrolase-like protein